MPQPTASPFQEPSTGVITAASLGPSLVAPTSGLTTEPPCTSWSYWRMTHSLLQTFQLARIWRRMALKSGATPGARVGVPALDGPQPAKAGTPTRAQGLGAGEA